MNRSVLLDGAHFYLGWRLRAEIPPCHRHEHSGHFGHLLAHCHQNFQKLIKNKSKQNKNKTRKVCLDSDYKELLKNTKSKKQLKKTVHMNVQLWYVQIWRDATGISSSLSLKWCFLKSSKTHGIMARLETRTTVCYTVHLQECLNR